MLISTQSMIVFIAETSWPWMYMSPCVITSWTTMMCHR